MNHHLKTSCEEIDACIFSSDILYQDKNSSELRIYVERWLRALDEHERLASQTGVDVDPWTEPGDPWPNP